MRIPIGSYALFGFVTSVIFALLEIQIEGASGWAKNLPTWRKFHPLTKLIPGDGKPLTGYHTYLWIFILLLLHSVFLFIPFDLRTEWILLSLFVYILALEDFLWFVLNPHFGLGKFKKEHIGWHKRWFLFFPYQYLLAAIVWLLFFYLGFS